MYLDYTYSFSNQNGHNLPVYQVIFLNLKDLIYCAWMSLVGTGCRLQTCRDLIVQWFKSTFRAYIVSDLRPISKANNSEYSQNIFKIYLCLLVYDNKKCLYGKTNHLVICKQGQKLGPQRQVFLVYYY